MWRWPNQAYFLLAAITISACNPNGALENPLNSAAESIIEVEANSDGVFAVTDAGSDAIPVEEVVRLSVGESITVDEVMGTIKAHTSGGSVKAHISKQPDSDCRLTTSGGSITVHLSADLGLDVNAKTNGGRVNTDFPVAISGEVSKRSMQAQMNGGGPELYLRTSGGSIYLKKL